MSGADLYRGRMARSRNDALAAWMAEHEVAAPHLADLVNEAMFGYPGDGATWVNALYSAGSPGRADGRRNVSGGALKRSPACLPPA